MSDYLIVNGDCRRVLGDLAGVDAVVTDPPYGINFKHSGHGRRLHARRSCNRWAEFIPGDDRPFEPEPWLKSGKPCLFWGAQHYLQRLPAGGSLLAWDKSCGIGPKDHFADGDFAWCSRPRVKRNVFRHLWKGVVSHKKGESNGRKFHPFLKPLALMRWCIRLMDLPPGSLILDPYMGSGTTLIAALAEGHRAVGIELDPRYCEIARRRIERPHAREPRPGREELLPLFEGMT